jgi:hypothetical protein
VVSRVSLDIPLGHNRQWQKICGLRYDCCEQITQARFYARRAECLLGIMFSESDILMIVQRAKVESRKSKTCGARLWLSKMHEEGNVFTKETKVLMRCRPCRKIARRRVQASIVLATRIADDSESMAAACGWVDFVYLAEAASRQVPKEGALEEQFLDTGLVQVTPAASSNQLPAQVKWRRNTLLRRQSRTAICTIMSSFHSTEIHQLVAISPFGATLRCDELDTVRLVVADLHSPPRLRWRLRPNCHNNLDALVYHGSDNAHCR